MKNTERSIALVMKDIGIVRHFDLAGRVTLPIELRKRLNLCTGDPIEIFTSDDAIILRKYQNKCVICDEAVDYDECYEFNGKQICKSCMEKIK